MSKKITIEEIQKRILKIHGNTIVLDIDTYVDTHTRARFIDRECGEWWAIPKNVYGLKNGHPNKRAKKISKSKTLTIDQVKEKIREKHGNSVILIESTYINTITKCKFIDEKYGEWETVSLNVLYDNCRHPNGGKERRENALLKSYGVKNATQNKEIALRAAKSAKNTYIKFHWKTNEELVCQGSWEAKVVDYFNTNKTEYDWQSKTFAMPDGKTYRPDLFLINENKWVEIKGRFRITDKLKWEWFKSENPTAEVWQKSKLKEMGIL